MKLRYTMVLAAMATGLLAACSPSPEGTVEKFYHAVEKNDDEAALKLIHPVSVQMMGVSKFRASFAKQRGKFEECGGIKSITVDMKGTADRKAGPAEVSFKGECKPQRDNLQMTKVDGTWYIGGL